MSVSKKLREYFGAPSARLEERLVDVEVALAIALDEGEEDFGGGRVE